MELKTKKKTPNLSKAKLAASALSTKTNPKANNAIPGSGADGPPQTLQPANSEFEQLIKGPALEPKKENRGGLRPGAGRPMGMGDDLAAVNRLPEKPNEAICAVLEMPFDLWAELNKMPELALTKEEARKLGLPVTQLLEFYFPGKIPVIAWVWMSLVGATANIVKPRFKVLSQRKAAGRAAKGGGAVGSPTSQLPAAGSKSSDMIPPATGHIRTI